MLRRVARATQAARPSTIRRRTTRSSPRPSAATSTRRERRTPASAQIRGRPSRSAETCNSDSAKTTRGGVDAGRRPSQGFPRTGAGILGGRCARTTLARIAPVRIEKTITIARGVEQVWEFIADARNDPCWCEKVASVEQVTGQGPGPSAKYRVLHRPRPRRAHRVGHGGGRVRAAAPPAMARGGRGRCIQRAVRTRARGRRYAAQPS
jgi:hypothetical protein